jgi:signal transduction histidine kinase
VRAARPGGTDSVSPSPPHSAHIQKTSSNPVYALLKEVAAEIHRTSTRQLGHRIAVAEPVLRDNLIEYLQSGGWIAEPTGECELTASRERGAAGDAERVNLRFSVAVWRVMNQDTPVSLRFESETADESVREERPEPEFVVTTLTDLSHELRTPLTAILGYLNLVLAEEAGELNDEQREHLEAVDRNARRLARLADEVLLLDETDLGA